MRGRRILLTGGTGFLGAAIARKLIENGSEVVALVRDLEAARGILPPQVLLLKGDITNSSKLPAFPSDVDTVIHSAGMLGTFLATESLYRLVNATGTENVLEAAQKAGIKRFLLVSSAGVLGPTRKRLADEAWPLAPSNGYERSKAEAEQIVREFHSTGRIETVIVRPEFVYGPRDLHVLGLFRAIRDRKFFLIGSGESLLHPTYIDDIVQGVLAALERSGFDGSAFILAGPKPMSVCELSKVVARSVGVTPRGIRIPLPLAFAGAAGFEFIGRLIRRDVPLNFSRVRFFTEDRAFQTGRAASVLGYVPLVSFEEGVRRTVAWYRAGNLL